MTSFYIKLFGTLAAWSIGIPIYMWWFQEFHYWANGSPYPQTNLWWIHLFGVWLHLCYYSKHKLELVICGKGTGIMLEDGLYWLPNIGHITISLADLPLITGVRNPHEEEMEQKGRIIGDIYTNQLLPQYRVNTTMGPVAATISRGFDALLVWTFRRPHLVPMRIGFLIMWATLLLSLVDARIGYLEPKQLIRMPEFSLPSLPDLPKVSSILRFGTDSTKQEEGPQRFAAPAPIEPPAELFIPTTEKGVKYYDIIGGRKYYLYSAPEPGHVDGFIVTESSCKLIPSGRKINIWSKYPPTSFKHMGEVTYYRVVPRAWLFGKDTIEEVTTSWQKLQESWHHVREDRDGEKVFQSESLPEYLTPRDSGGMICF